MPGRRSTTRYCPVASVVTVRTFSIRTGLATSTVTPGSTAPDVSLTRPVTAPCARAAAGKHNNIDSTAAPAARLACLSAITTRDGPTIRVHLTKCLDAIRAAGLRAVGSELRDPAHPKRAHY